MHSRGGRAGVPRREAHAQLAARRLGTGLAGQPHHNGNGATTIRLDAIDAGKLLGGFSGQAPVDYLLVNIESAWYEMLKHGEWTQNVRCIKIEIQDHYDEAVPLLEALGYQARLEWLNWGAFAVGIRRQIAVRPAHERLAQSVSPPCVSLAPAQSSGPAVGWGGVRARARRRGTTG